MILTYLRRRYAKARMTAYVNGELSPSTRQLIAEQIERSPDVYQAYRMHRQIKQHLEDELAGFGQPEQDRLESLWASIETQMQQPEAVSPPTRRPAGPRMSFSYGLAVVLCALALLLPLTLDSGAVRASSTPGTAQPLQIVPQRVVVMETPILTEPLPDSGTDSNHVFRTDAAQTENPLQPVEETPVIRTPSP